MTKTIIVIPTYNEASNIETLIQSIFDLDIKELSIIVIDDNSPDNTSTIVQNLTKKYPILLLKRNKKLGLGSAYIKGFKMALKIKADQIVQMDADLSHDPNDIPRLIKELEEADLVIGSRKIPEGKIEGWGIGRKLMSSSAMWISRLLLGLKTKDVTSGFRCFDSKILKTMDLDTVASSGYAFQEEMLYRTQTLGFSIKEIPVVFKDRKKGKSKLSKKDILEFFIVIAKLMKTNNR